MDLAWKRGLILSGPPGNGKTLIGKILASSGEGNFIWITANDIQEGNTVNISSIFEFARLISPCILFIEDLDLSGAGERETGNLFKPILSEMLNQIDGFKPNDGVVTIATTNNLNSLDKAISERPGRFDVKILLPNPDFNQRLKILRRFTKNFKLAEGINLEYIAKNTDGFSCAYVREIITRAAMSAIQRDYDEKAQEPVLGQEDFQKAVQFMIKHKKVIGFARSQEFF